MVIRVLGDQISFYALTRIALGKVIKEEFNFSEGFGLGIALKKKRNAFEIIRLDLGIKV